MSPVRKDYVRPVDFRNGRVDLSHGGGGRAMAQLIDELFLTAFDNEWLGQLGDATSIDLSSIIHAPSSGQLAFTTDSFVVSPLFFPGGNIGELAVYGTVNDLAVSGARPERSAGGGVGLGGTLARLRTLPAARSVWRWLRVALACRAA